MDAAELIAGWWAWIAPATLQATALLALAWLLDRCFARRAWPQLLALAWCAALTRFFLPPELSSPWSVTATLGASTLAATKVTPSASVLIACASLWLVGAFTLLALRASRRARLRARIEFVQLDEAWLAALHRAAVRAGLERTPRVGTLDELATPALFGALAPILLLPRAALARTPTVRDEHALLHELMHIRRRDAWLDEASALVRAFAWFHPLVWLAVERVHALSELACDHAVARALGHEAHEYRDTLVLAARTLLDRNAPSEVRAFVSRRAAIVARIEQIESAARRPLSLVRSASALAAVALAACVLPMAPNAADFRAQARAVLDAQRAGERQSCFTVHAAALLLADEPTSTSHTAGDSR